MGLSLVVFGVKLILYVRGLVSLWGLLHRLFQAHLVMSGWIYCFFLGFFVLLSHKIVVCYLVFLRTFHSHRFLTMKQFFLWKRGIQVIVPLVWISFKILALNNLMEIQLRQLLVWTSHIFNSFFSMIKSVLVQRWHHLLILSIVILLQRNLGFSEHGVNHLFFLEIAANRMCLHMEVGR